MTAPPLGIVMTRLEKTAIAVVVLMFITIWWCFIELLVWHISR